MVIGITAIRHIVLYHFLLMVCTNDISTFHHFRDITTFTVYVTACHREKSFIAIRQLKLQATCAFRSCLNMIMAVNTSYISRSVGVTGLSYLK